MGRWEERFKELVAHKQKNNDCTNVSSARDYKLGNWVARQRQCYKKGKLSKERIARLEGIGFSWSATPLCAVNRRWHTRSNAPKTASVPKADRVSMSRTDGNGKTDIDEFADIEECSV